MPRVERARELHNRGREVNRAASAGIGTGQAGTRFDRSRFVHCCKPGTCPGYLLRFIVSTTKDMSMIMQIRSLPESIRTESRR